MAKFRGRKLIMSNKDRDRQVSMDKRPHWSDPNLPCIRDYRFGDGSRKTEIDPEYEQRYRAMLMETSAQPNYRNDPTYNLRRKPK